MRFLPSFCMLLLWAQHALAECKKFSTSSGTKAVFAHFMLSNGIGHSDSTWDYHIRLARDVHIDGFALNFHFDEGVTNDLIDRVFAAANRVSPPFKLFFSFDYGSHDLDPNTIVSTINRYQNNNAYFRHGGKPLVSSFEVPVDPNSWVSIKSKTGCFFLPSFSSLGAKKAMETGVVDGLFSWAAWPEGPRGMYSMVDASYRQYLGGKPYMMAVSPWFFTALPGYQKMWTWRGGNLWYERWVQVNCIQPEYVQIISWNDYGESHHIGPLTGGYRAFEQDTGRAQFQYYVGNPHDGWRLFLPFWIDQYKYGTATVVKEGLTIWYHRNPGQGCASNVVGNTATHLQDIYPAFVVVEDRIFFQALLGSGAAVTITIGGVTRTGSWQWAPDGGVGIYQGNIPFDGLTGAVSISLSRGGVVFATVNGPAITTDCSTTKGYVNWNAWVGYTNAAASISAKPAKHMNDQVCVLGTGPPQYAELCAFTCQYGYCPIGQCTCRIMGIQRTLPTATGDHACPNSGLDSTYNGLCSFACDRGFCPSNYCTKLPKGTVCTNPIASSPPIPHCVAGTSGNGTDTYSQLCSLACAHGFCPPSHCWCQLAGFQPRPVPLPLNGDTGEPIFAGTDAGLCAWNCARGWCPPEVCRRIRPVKTTTPAPVPTSAPVYRWYIYDFSRNLLVFTSLFGTQVQVTGDKVEKYGIQFWNNRPQCSPDILRVSNKNMLFESFPWAVDNANVQGFNCDGCFWSSPSNVWKIKKLEILDDPKRPFTDKGLGYLNIVHNPDVPESKRYQEFIVNSNSRDGTLTGRWGYCWVAGSRDSDRDGPSRRHNCFDYTSLHRVQTEELLRCETTFKIIDGGN